MNGCGKVKPKVPAHRVVNRLGILSGKHHFSPPGMMEKLLKKEGIKVKNDQIVDFKKYFWDPVEELDFNSNSYQLNSRDKVEFLLQNGMIFKY